MAKYICMICGYVYDEAAGAPDKGIPAGTVWADVTSDFECPLCGAPKAGFDVQEEDSLQEKVVSQELVQAVLDMTPAHMSVLCANLSRGFEKQYKEEQADLFGQLGRYFKEKVIEPEEASLELLSQAVKKDLDEGIPTAQVVCKEAKQRGSLRAMVWAEKVTRMLSSILKQQASKGNNLTEDKNVYVCEICGFVYIGDEVPDICPVCKVPSMKINKIGRG